MLTSGLASPILLVLSSEVWSTVYIEFFILKLPVPHDLLELNCVIVLQPLVKVKAFM